MKHVINSTFAPAHAGHFHHFTITRLHTASHAEIRIAYALETSEGAQVDTYVSTEACASAARFLSPEAHAAFLYQLTNGWRGFDIGIAAYAAHG